MKIAYLSSHYPAVSHTFVWREVQALRRLGLDVETLSVHAAAPDQLLTDDDREAARTTFAALPISAIALIGTHARAFGRHPGRYASTLARAWRMARPGVRGRVWQLFYFAEAIVLHAHCERRGVRHVHAQFADVATDVALLVAHHGGSDWSWSMAVHGPVEFYDVPGSRLAAKARDARFVQAISHFGRSQLLTLLEESEWGKVHVVRCGVEPAIYAPPRAARPAGDELRVLCVGRLVSLKGQSLLVEAIGELARRGIRARVILVGEGPKRAALEQLAVERGVADRVQLLGSVGQDTIREHYLAADVFCLPSFAEGVPVVLMEAMALELPVVTTRIMGIPELVEDGVHGRLVAPGSLPELVDALAALAADPQRRAEMGRAGRRRVLAEFDVDRSAPKLAELFAAVG
jgi:glycosyltransferase involved in cell wall biosynthesis